MKFRWAASFFYSAVRSEATAVSTTALAHWSLSLCLLSPRVSLPHSYLLYLIILVASSVRLDVLAGRGGDGGVPFDYINWLRLQEMIRCFTSDGPLHHVYWLREWFWSSYCSMWCSEGLWPNRMVLCLCRGIWILRIIYHVGEKLLEKWTRSCPDIKVSNIKEVSMQTICFFYFQTNNFCSPSPRLYWKFWQTFWLYNY